MYRITKSLIATGLIALTASVGQAALIYSDSFESPAAPADPGYALGAPTGWTAGGLSAGGVGRVLNTADIVGEHLTQYVFIATGDVGNEATLTSSSIGSSVLGATYTAIVDVGNRDNLFASANNGDYEIAILEDGVEVVSTLLAGNTITADTFVPLSTSYVAAANGADLTIELRWTHHTSGGPFQGVYDNLRVYDAPIPEPTSLSLVALCAVGAMIRRRR